MATAFYGKMTDAKPGHPIMDGSTRSTAGNRARPFANPEEPCS
jgi:hypothetical protein